MDNKTKLVSAVCALMGVSAFSIGNSAELWSESKVSSYVAGTQVIDNGKTYQCKEWPASGWCKISVYKPSGMYGQDAWTLVSDSGSSAPEPTPEPSPEPTPTPEQPSNPDASIQQWDANTVYNPSDSSKPSKVIYDGKVYAAKWWTRGENPSKSGEWGVWKLVSDSVEQEQGTLNISVPLKPDFITGSSLPSVKIYDSNNAEVAEQNNIQWGSVTNIKVPAGDLKIEISDIGASQGDASPETITVAKDETKNIEVKYSTPAPAEIGSLEITLDSTNLQDVGDVKTTYTLQDKNDNIIKQGEIDFGDNISIDNLVATEEGTSYKLSIDSFYHNGFKYVVAPIDVTVTRFNTSKINVKFSQEQIQTEEISFKVSGVPETQVPTITLVNANGEKHQIDVQKDGTYKIELAQDGSTWNIIVTSVKGYTESTSQAQFIANGKPVVVNIDYKEIPKTSGWPDRAVVGYVKGYNSKWYSQPDTTTQMVSTALDRGYNVLVYAFIGQDTDGTVFFDSPFAVDNMKLEWEDSLVAQLPEQMKIIHQKGGIALIAIGGGVNFFKPDMSGEKAVSAGKAMGKFIAEHNFDGLDIDVEHPVGAAKIDANFLRYIEATRQEYKNITGKDMYLTAAPQIQGWYGSGQWASGSAKFAEPMYTQNFVDNAHFDAFFIQTYNQYGGANFAGLKGQDVGFLTKTFELLSPQTRDKMPGLPADAFYVPEGTKIVLGVPNFKDPSVSDSEYRVGTCLATAECSGSGLYDPKDIATDITNGGLGKYSQYGGVMTWIMNSDDYQGWTWVDGVKVVAYN